MKKRYEYRETNDDYGVTWQFFAVHGVGHFESQTVTRLEALYFGVIGVLNERPA